MRACCTRAGEIELVVIRVLPVALKEHHQSEPLSRARFRESEIIRIALTGR